MVSEKRRFPYRGMREESWNTRKDSGFSLTEMIVVVGAIAVMAAVLIPGMINVFKGTQAGTAEANLEHLNQAVLKYSHAVAELTNAVNSGIGDEQAVFTVLQARDESVPGSPYLPSNLSASASTDTNAYRAVWNGRMFQIVEPGTAGTGVDLSRLYNQ